MNESVDMLVSVDKKFLFEFHRILTNNNERNINLTHEILLSYRDELYETMAKYLSNLELENFKDLYNKYPRPERFWPGFWRHYIGAIVSNLQR